MKKHLTLLAVLLSFMPLTSYADQIKVAVASNFINAITELAESFEKQTGHDVQLIFGATGKIYAQIQHGAPFDLFFAADTERPALLEKQQQIQPNSRFTYARGKLALWSSDAQLVDDKGQVLRSGNFRHLAIANPKLAPYGLAAQQTLEAKGLWPNVQKKLVQGENIGQTFQFVRSGNAELGFVALSQLLHSTHKETGSIWEVPSELYDPIDQQVVQLTANPVATEFLTYVKSDAGSAIIQRYGYDIP